MDKKIDKKTEELAMRALENAKAFGQKLEENREKRLWKKVQIPCSLYDAIKGLTKNEMDAIRKTYGFKNLSALKKAELAPELAKLIPSKFKQIIYTLDQSRYDLIKLIIKNSGVIPDMGISISNAETFMNYSMIFCGLQDNQKVLFMPNELINVFTQIDDSKLKNIVRRNTEWIRLTHGLLYYYGVMDAWPITKKISELTGENIDILEFIHVMSFACDFYDQAVYTPYGYADSRVFDVKKIVEEQKMRKQIDYYPITKNHLLKASAPNYFDKTQEMRSFINFILEYYDLSDEEMDEIAFQMVTMINLDFRPDMIMEYLQSYLEFPSFEFAQQLVGEVMELYNNTRQWVLKGHTPNEMFKEERKFLQPLPEEPFITNKQHSSVIDLKTKKKIGRNDPCPCGSGKKFKNCCGKVR